jgi:hypothetical protein
VGINCQLAKGEAWPRRLMLPAPSIFDLAKFVEKYFLPFPRYTGTLPLPGGLHAGRRGGLSVKADGLGWSTSRLLSQLPRKIHLEAQLAIGLP